MSRVRIALANLPFAPTPRESVVRAAEAIAEAGARAAEIVCFPEAYVPGYRAPGRDVPPPDAGFLARAWATLAEAAARAHVTVVLGTERIVAGATRLTALVIDGDGSPVGFQDGCFQDSCFQDKVQLDPSEEATYAPGTERRLFRAGALTFGVAICHEGWRYPETVRWAARRGAQLVFHPHVHEAEPGGHRPTTFAEPANTFHEKALLCRAAENTCYVASVNGASPGSPTTSVVVRPDGTVLAWQPYGEAGLLVADLDLALATGLLAARLRTAP